MKRVLSLPLLVLALGACARAPAPEAGELRIVPLSGAVSFVDGDDTTVLDEVMNVEAGVALRTGLDGRARVEFPGGASMELAPNASIRLHETDPEVSRGSVLVRTGGSGVSLHAGAAEIEATGAEFRVERQTSVILGVYSGEAALPGAGVVVPSLRQATVLGDGSISGALEPLDVKANNLWDIQFLGKAIDVGFQLLNLERGLTRQLPRGEEERAVSAALRRDFSPAAIRAAIQELGNAAEAVVAAVVAREIERIDGGSRARILADVVDLQALGNNWIVIVAEWGLAEAADALLDQLGELAVSIAQSVAPPEAPAPSQASASAGTGGSTGGGSGGTDPGGPGPGGTDPGDSPGSDNRKGDQRPPPPPPEEPADDAPAQGCANEVECTVNDVIGDTP